jgi:predicted ATPase with chaperone activity
MHEPREGYLEDLLTRLRANSGVRSSPAPAVRKSHENSPNLIANLDVIESALATLEPPAPPFGVSPETFATNHVATPENPAFWQQLRSELNEGSTASSSLIAAKSNVGSHPSPVPLSQLAPSSLPRSTPQPRVKPAPAPKARAKAPEFFPREPESLETAHITATEVEMLALKVMLNRGTTTGRAIAAQIRLAFKIVHEIMDGLRAEKLVVYKGSSPVNDYEYQLTATGREQARRLYEHSTYFGSAPVTLDEYIKAIAAQSLQKSQPRIADLQKAFHDLLIRPELLSQVAQAIHHGRGLFLYGSPGNGKTSIAQRITKAFGEQLWIPRAIGIDGDILRLYDPCVHEELPLPHYEDDALRAHIDQRWIRIRRPTIIAGGELTMERLEVTRNTSTGTNEAPLQLKSNCGTLVIDDFGRQRISVEELLNRWIVPLDKGYDFLSLPSGKTIQVPFDQMLVFSTNMQPRDLADEAFLRRIPYKIDIGDPPESHFRELMQREAKNMNVKFDERAVEYLIQKHYRPNQRAFRCCHPRDLLSQVRTFCQVHEVPVEMTVQSLDAAVGNYFAVL